MELLLKSDEPGAAKLIDDLPRDAFANDALFTGLGRALS